MSVPALPATFISTSRSTGGPRRGRACVWLLVQKIARAAPWRSWATTNTSTTVETSSIEKPASINRLASAVNSDREPAAAATAGRAGSQLARRRGGDQEADRRRVVPGLEREEGDRDGGDAKADREREDDREAGDPVRSHPDSMSRMDAGSDSLRRASGPHLLAAYHRVMPVLRSRLDPAAADVRANHDAMAVLVDDLRARQAAIAERGAGGDERSIERHRERGKLPVRERIERLLDPGSAFLELSPLAANGLYDDDAPGAGIVTGVGRIEGTTCVIVANDATVKGGTYYPMTVRRTSASAGDRAREPAAVRLSRRFWRRVPAAPGRGLPGSRPFRADLL